MYVVLTVGEKAKVSVVDHGMVGFIVAIQRPLSLSHIGYLTNVYTCVRVNTHTQVPHTLCMHYKEHGRSVT